MRIAVGFILAICFAASLFAQPRGAQPAGISGSVVYPAGAPGTPGITRITPSVVHPGGGGPPRPVVPGQNGRGGYTGVSGRVYAYPIYIGGYYSAPYVATDGYGAAAPVQPDPVPMPAQAAPTPIIINNYYSGAPAANQEAAPQQPAADEATPTIEPSHYLIAFLDHTIYAAAAYWVDGDTLHYFTSGNVHNQVSLALVDRAFTERLNKEAGVDVKLPAPSGK